MENEDFREIREIDNKEYKQLQKNKELEDKEII